MRGTPKTLREAIEIGVEEYLGFMPDPSLTDSVKVHVIDFLSQHFNAEILNSTGKPAETTLFTLWNRIRRDDFSLEAPDAQPR